MSEIEERSLRSESEVEKRALSIGMIIVSNYLLNSSRDHQPTIDESRYCPLRCEQIGYEIVHGPRCETMII